MVQHKTSSAKAPDEFEEDFILKQHNDGLRKEEIAWQCARLYHDRDPSPADHKRVDEVLTNREG